MKGRSLNSSGTSNHLLNLKEDCVKGVIKIKKEEKIKNKKENKKSV